MANNDYRDPRFDELDKKYADLVGVPYGLMKSIRVAGERTNNDQVAKGTGAKGVNQITPQTRDLFLKKYGVDAYLSDANAAHVKALHLKESLDRNNGDVKAAAIEYISGPSGKNRGPVTDAYAQRVTRSLTADLAQARQGTSQIAKIYDAYKSGRMTPDEAAEFETDVRSGRLVLPESMPIKESPKAEAPKVDKAKIIEAYQKGRMTEEEAAAFEADMDSGAFTLPSGVKREDVQPPGVMARIGDVFTGGLRRTKESESLPEWTGMPELNQLSAASAKAGLGTMFAGSDEAVNVLKSQFPGLGVRQDEAGNYILKSTVDKKEYVIPPGLRMGDIPRLIGGVAAFTPAGRVASLPGTMAASAGTQAAIEASQAATGGEFNATDVALAGGAAALPAVVQATKAGMKQAVKPLATRVVNAYDARQAAKAGATTGAPTTGAAPVATPGTGGSVGAAGVDMAQVRQTAAAELPVPIQLTEGQATKGFGAQQFEREVAKQEIGAPIRERFAVQNAQLQQNFDAFIDESGARAAGRQQVGESVDQALVKRMERDKAEIRSAYKEAEKAGEMGEPVALDDLAAYLNQNRAGRNAAPIMKAIEDEAYVMEVATGSLNDGTLAFKELTLKQAEDLRKAINRNLDMSKPNDARVASELKALIDQATDGLGGDLYKKARDLRSRYGQNFANNTLVRNLTSMKRGSTDRAIALENVFSRSILGSSLDDVKHLHKVLMESGEQGQQAWRDLRGQTLEHLRGKMTEGMARDSAGNIVPSAAGLDRAIRGLDDVGKLEYIFGKKGAEQLRTLNDVAQDVLIPTQGTANQSGTSAALLAAIDMMISGASGMPAPVMSGMRLLQRQIKDRQIQRKIERALNYDAKRQAQKQQPKQAKF